MDVRGQACLLAGLAHQDVGLPHRFLLLEDQARGLADARVVEHAAAQRQLCDMEWNIRTTKDQTLAGGDTKQPTDTTQANANANANGPACGSS
jgi:hypothetical protein